MAEGGSGEDGEKRWRISEVIWAEADVGCPFVCCEYVLLPLVDKEGALTYGMAGEI